MSSRLYVGVNGTARRVKNLYVGVNGTARKVTKAWVGDANGKARLCYFRKMIEVVVLGAANDSIVYNYNGVVNRIYTDSSGIASLKIEVEDKNPTIIFSSEVTGYNRTLNIDTDGPFPVNAYVRPKHCAYWWGVSKLGFNYLLSYTNDIQNRCMNIYTLNDDSFYTLYPYTMFFIDNQGDGTISTGSSIYAHFTLRNSLNYGIEYNDYYQAYMARINFTQPNAQYTLRYLYAGDYYD